MDLIAYAIPFFILAMIVELGWGLFTGRNTYRVNDAVGSLFLGTLSQTRRFVTSRCHETFRKKECLKLLVRFDSRKWNIDNIALCVVSQGFDEARLSSSWWTM